MAWWGSPRESRHGSRDHAEAWRLSKDYLGPRQKCWDSTIPVIDRQAVMYDFCGPMWDWKARVVLVIVWKPGEWFLIACGLNSVSLSGYGMDSLIIHLRHFRRLCGFPSLSLSVFFPFLSFLSLLSAEISENGASRPWVGWGPVGLRLSIFEWVRNRHQQRDDNKRWRLSLLMFSDCSPSFSLFPSLFG